MGGADWRVELPGIGCLLSGGKTKEISINNIGVKVLTTTKSETPKTNNKQTSNNKQ